MFWVGICGSPGSAGTTWQQLRDVPWTLVSGTLLS